MRTGEMPSQIVNQSNSSKIIDEKILTKAIEDAFDSERAAVIDASSNPGVVNFLLGKVLKLTEGRADPKIALSLIRDKLNKID
jgi:aspartyl-tRNA(Asn)/glutamyl-tRNA(Gln) amidotransferase subunit B